MNLLQKILDNKDNLEEDKWFYPQDLLENFQIYEHISIDDRITKKWFERWTCTDTQVGIAVYFLDDEIVCISFQPYRKSDEEFWFVSEESGKKVREYFWSLTNRDEVCFNLIDNMPDLEQHSSEIDFKKFEFSAQNKIKDE